jgi:hypothetical protein
VPERENAVGQTKKEAKAYHARWYRKNRKQVAEDQAAYYRANRKTVRARCAAYYRRNRNKCRECSRKWDRNNPEKRRESYRRWKKRYPERNKAHQRKWYNKNIEQIKIRQRAWQNKNPGASRKWQKKNPERAAAVSAKTKLRAFLRACSITSFDDLGDVPSATLLKLTKGNGWPDFKKECLEEKRAGDSLQPSQWARAILEYRAGRKYRVAWRFTSTRRKVFKNVFAFYKWQIDRGVSRAQ